MGITAQATTGQLHTDVKQIGLRVTADAYRHSTASRWRLGMDVIEVTETEVETRNRRHSQIGGYKIQILQLDVGRTINSDSSTSGCGDGGSRITTYRQTVEIVRHSQWLR